MRLNTLESHQAMKIAPRDNYARRNSHCSKLISTNARNKRLIISTRLEKKQPATDCTEINLTNASFMSSTEGICLTQTLHSAIFFPWVTPKASSLLQRFTTEFGMESEWDHAQKAPGKLLGVSG